MYCDRLLNLLLLSWLLAPLPAFALSKTQPLSLSSQPLSSQSHASPSQFLSQSSPKSSQISTHAQQAQQLFTRSLQIARTLPPDEFRHEQVRAKSETLAAIAVQLVQAGEPQQAEIVFQEAELGIRRNLLDWERDEALVVLAVRLTEAGLTDAALKIVKGLSLADLPDERNYRQASALTEIVAQLIAQGQIEAAQQLMPKTLKLAQQIAETAGYESNGSCARWRYEVLTGAAKNLAALHQVQQALALVRQTSSCSAASEGGTDYQFQGILVVLKHVKTNQEITQVMATIKSLQPNSLHDQAFHETAIKAAMLKKMPSARLASGAIQDRWLKQYTDFIIASYDLKLDDRQRSLDLVIQTEKFYSKHAQEDNTVWFDSIMLKHLAENLVKVGHLDLVERLRLRDGVGFNDRVAIQFAQMGEISASLEMLKTLGDTSSWTTALPYFQNPQDLEQSLQWVRSPNFVGAAYPDVRDAISLSITEQFLRLHQVNAAQQTAEKIYDPATQAKALAIVATYLNTVNRK
jgi:hypothetical protein